MDARLDPSLRVIPFLLASLALGWLFMALFWFIGQVLTGFPALPSRPKRPRSVAWGASAIVFVIVSWVLINLTVPVIYLQLRSQFPIQAAAAPRPTANPSLASESGIAVVAPRLSVTEQMVLISLINGLLLVVLPLGLPVASGAGWNDLGLSADDPGRELKLGAKAFLVVTPLVIAVNGIAVLIWKPNSHPLERMLRDEASPLMIVLAYVSAVVLAPAAEELIFRGVIQGGLRGLLSGDIGTSGERPQWRWLPRIPGLPAPALDSGPDGGAFFESGDPSPAGRRYLPIVLTSVLFAAVHYQQMPAPLAIFPLSIALGVLYESTGSLVPSFVLHALFNGFSTTLLVAHLLLAPQPTR